MRLQLFGVGSVPVLTLPLKSDDDSIINLSAPAPWLDMNEQRCLTILGGRLENGNYPTLRLYFVQQWRRMRDQQFINRDSFLLKRLNGSFYINRIPECYRRRM
ncbi:hypothetical protein ACN5L5_004082 [Cronobacter turicensis]|uniref:hypothetical protein n=1 Tax=Cronobacter dublinensis TaxID=413497 RepID=UPI0018D11DD0|nr:hypothetical protein [Cronobacter dublinensis]ELY3387545.1 hypothetical protein [Cronobacter sakazakii]